MNRPAALLTVFLPVFILLAIPAQAQDEPTMPARLIDLVPQPDQAVVTTVPVAVSTASEPLMRIIAGTAGAGALAHPGFVHVDAHPVPSLALLDHTDLLPGSNLVVVELTFDAEFETVPDLLKRIANDLQVQWYAESAVVWTPDFTLPPEEIGDPDIGIDGPRDSEENSAGHPMMLARIGVRLAPVDMIVAYWRVALPVATVLPIPLETERVSLLGQAAQTIANIAPPRMMVAFAGPEDTTRSRPETLAFTRIASERPAVALAFLRKTSERKTTTAIVDPANRIPELDETNNQAIIELVAPHPTPAEDLSFTGNMLHTDPVEITPVAWDANLRRLVHNDAMRLLLRKQLPGWIGIIPLGGDDPWRVDPENMPPEATHHDLIMTARIHGDATSDGTVSDIAEELAEHLRQQWYTAEATVLADWPTITDWLTDGEDPAGWDRETIVVGLKLVDNEDARPYWLVSGGVQRKTHMELPTTVSDIPTPPPVRIVDVAVTAADVSDRGGIVEAVTLAASASVDFVSLFERVPGILELRGVATLDPKNQVKEWDEENNQRAFAWSQPPPPEPNEDLRPLGDEASSRLVDCTASVQNPVLIELMRKASLHVLAGEKRFRSVHVYPWRAAAVGVKDFVETEDMRDFDVVVACVFSSGPPPDAIAQALADVLAEKWYADKAAPIRVLPPWVANAPFAGFAGPSMVSVGVKLAETDEVRSYWRMATPIVRRSVDGIQFEEPQDPEQPFKWTQDWLDHVTNALLPDDIAPKLGRPEERPEPKRALLVEIQFQGTFSDPNIDGSGRSGGEAWDHVWLAPNGHAIAVGLVEAPSAPLQGTATVDANNAIEETDETNNTCRVPLPTPDEPDGTFTAKVRVLAPTTTQGECLEVVGILRNQSLGTLTVTFPSTLQIDYRIDEVYQWSADKFFPQVITEVTIPPRSSMSWRLCTPLAELPLAGDERRVTVFLNGTEYQQSLPFPGSETPQVETENPDETDDAPPETIIVGPAGVNLHRLIRHMVGNPTDAIVQVPVGGNLEIDGDVWKYTPLSGFRGLDYLLVAVEDSLGKSKIVAQPLQVGPQTVELRLSAGWSLVSFPVEPVEVLDELLARVPHGSAWSWNGASYTIPDKISVGDGFWIFSDQEMVLSYLGIPAPQTERVLTRGWNLLGSVNRLDLEAHPAVRTAYAWGSNGYKSGTRIGQGQAMWVYVEDPTHIPLR